MAGSAMTSSGQLAELNEPWFLRAVAAGVAAWPRLAVDLEAFARFLQPRRIDADVSASLAADLYLACACTTSVPGAVEALMQAHAQTIRGAAASFDASAAFADEVKQRLGELLFVPRGGGPGSISRYGGQGPLAAWLETVVRRIALRLAKANATGKFVGEDALARHFSGATDPDTVVLRGRYKAHFDSAIVTALRRLGPRDRLILRLNMVEGISMDRIAKMQKVSQPTVSRWMQQARVEILRTVRDLIRDELEIDDGEFDSLLRLLRSQIDLSFSQLLGDTREGGAGGRSSDGD